MKKILLAIAFFAGIASANAQQDLPKNLSTAKTTYQAGKLEDAHFALQQALQEVDIVIGKEILKLFPTKLDTLLVVDKEDHVTGNVGFVGATVERNYGTHNKKAELQVISNSPLIGSLNMFLNSSLGGFMNDGKNKVVKVQGYKARLTQEEGYNNTIGYKLEIPFNNALVSLHVNNSTDTEVLNFANALPLAQIAKLIQ